MRHPLKFACACALLSLLGCSDDAPGRQLDDASDARTDVDRDPQMAAPKLDAGKSTGADAARARDAGIGAAPPTTARDSGRAPLEGGRDAGRVDAGQTQLPREDAGIKIDAAVEPGASCTASGSAAPRALPLTGNLGTHDPVLIAAGGTYYMFQTGRGLPTKTSTDLMRWSAGAPVFGSNPAWVTQQVPGATDLWAPDISQFGDAYHLYYSVSTFGSNRSCIGHATRADLKSGAWQDQGSVVCSNANGARDDWNAIDPNVIVDDQGTPWMSFGSFWSGIKMIKLDAQGKRADNQLIALAGRRNGGAIEAPFIVRRCGYYYLFVSFDRCCAGADSTYRIMVGRSRSVTGPYVDKAGVELTRDGGSEVLKGDGTWRGPGHNAVLLTPQGDYNVYHAYSARDGHSELRISELHWDADGWPVSAGP
jgi:arabinan endo-1,5-alpha-L-arabinosidase